MNGAGPGHTGSNSGGCLVLCPDFRYGEAPRRDAEARLAEAVGLAVRLDRMPARLRLFVVEGGSFEPGPLSGRLGPTVDAIADVYWSLHRQHPSTWTLELDVRPYKESF